MIQAGSCRPVLRLLFWKKYGIAFDPPPWLWNWQPAACNGRHADQPSDFVLLCSVIVMVARLPAERRKSRTAKKRTRRTRRRSRRSEKRACGDTIEESSSVDEVDARRKRPWYYKESPYSRLTHLRSDFSLHHHVTPLRAHSLSSNEMWYQERVAVHFGSLTCWNFCIKGRGVDWAVQERSLESIKTKLKHLPDESRPLKRRRTREVLAVSIRDAAADSESAQLTGHVWHALHEDLQARCFKPVCAPRLTAENRLARLNFCRDELQRVGVLSVRGKRHFKQLGLTRVVFSDEKFFR